MFTGLAIELPFDFFLPLIITVISIYLREKKGKPTRKLLIIGLLLQLVWIIGLFILGLRGMASMMNTIG